MDSITLPDDLIVPTHATLLGVDGNAFSVIAYVSKKLKEAGNSKAVIDAYRTEAMSGDYNHLLNVSMTYIGEA